MSLEKPILVFGAGGQLGRECLALAKARGVLAIGLPRAEADITDMQSVMQAIERSKPRLILNAAAYTAVDKAESEPEAAHAVNVRGAENIARAAAQFDLPIVHISTDYVFDGSKQGAYVESDPIAPLGIYGATKAEGEARVRAANERHIILRSSWVFGQYDANFLKTILRLAAERDVLRIVADQRGCPTSTLDISEAVFAVDAYLATYEAAVLEQTVPWGTYHFAGTGVTTWHDFAAFIVETQAANGGRRPSVDPIPTQDYPTPARRPANSELDSTRFISLFNYRALDWRTRAQEVIAALGSN
jgi:dTDP-4-dehydrorhamnose reductase